MKPKTYTEKLKDPRWQKKRLEVLERDNFTCRACGETEKTLHVHHLAYSKEPWDVNMDDLLTLCEYCHNVAHELKKIDADMIYIESVSSAINDQIFIALDGGIE